MQMHTILHSSPAGGGAKLASHCHTHCLSCVPSTIPKLVSCYRGKLSAYACVLYTLAFAHICPDSLDTSVAKILLHVSVCNALCLRICMHAQHMLA